MESLSNLHAYSGHWVALVKDGQVAGVGVTPDAAARQAGYNRPRERFTLQYVEPPGGQPLALSPLLDQLRPVLHAQDTPVYLVGGAVRDALSGYASHDLDFVTPSGGINLAFRIGNALGWPAYILDKKRDTGRVVLANDRTMLDFACFRGPDLASDLRDRDFTINAMALPASAQTSASIIDPFGGQADLAAGILRQTTPHALLDDPLRALRAVRLSVHFRLQIEADTAAAARRAAPLLDTVSPERLRDELLKCLKTDAPHQAVSLLSELELLPYALPEIAALAGVTQSPPHHENVLAHTLRALRWLTAVEEAVVQQKPTTGLPPAAQTFLQQAQTGLAAYAGSLQTHLARAITGGLTGGQALRWAALWHDAGKAVTRTVAADGRIRFLGHDKVGATLVEPRLRHLRFSNEAIAHIQAVVAGHMRPLLFSQQPTVSRRAAYRFFREIGHAGLDNGLLALADHLATYDGPPGHLETGQQAGEHLLQVVTQLYAFYFQQFEQTVRPTPLFNGHQLMQALHLPSSPEVGRLLRLIEEAQVAGEITTREEALQLVRQALA